MRKRVLALAAVAVLLGAFVVACGSSSGVPKGAIAKVGSGVVTQAQFDKIISEAKAQAKSQASNAPFPAVGSAQYDQFAARVVDYLVELELIHQQADKMKITVTDKDVTTRIDAINKAYGGAAKVATILKQQGMTQADLQQQVKDQLIAEAVQKNVYSSIKVTDQQAQAYFTPESSPSSPSPRPAPRATSSSRRRPRPTRCAPCWWPIRALPTGRRSPRSTASTPAARTTAALSATSPRARWWPPSRRSTSRSRWASSRSRSRRSTAGTSSRSPRSRRRPRRPSPRSRIRSSRRCWRSSSRRPGPPGSPRSRKTPRSPTPRATIPAS